jgi:hypothetical protein
VRRFKVKAFGFKQTQTIVLFTQQLQLLLKLLAFYIFELKNEVEDNNILDLVMENAFRCLNEKK